MVFAEAHNDKCHKPICFTISIGALRNNLAQQIVCAHQIGMVCIAYLNLLCVVDTTHQFYLRSYILNDVFLECKVGHKMLS